MKPALAVDCSVHMSNERKDDPVMRKTIRRFLRATSAATAIEYGLIAAGIAVAIIAIVNTLGSQIAAIFTTISTQLK